MDKRLRFSEFLLDLACVFLIAAVLMAGSARAAVGYGGCTMPGQMCIQGNSVGVDVSARQSGNGVPQPPSNNVMNVLIPITIGVAAVGAAAVAIPAVGTAAVAGDVMASVGMTAIRGGIIGGVALATLMNRLGGDVSLDADGKVVVAVSPGAGADGHLWIINMNGVQYSGGGPDAACRAAFNLPSPYSYAGISELQSNGQSASCLASNPNASGSNYAYATTFKQSSCATGYTQQADGSCVANGPVQTRPATDAEIQNAIKAHPDSWPSIYNDMNCGPTLALTNGSTSDPCYALYSDSRTGFGVSFSTGGSSWTNNGCAVNSATCPSATVTTAPTTDSSTKVNADGSKTTTTNTTTKTTTVTGTNDRTNPVEGQTTTTTSTSTTVTNPDGSTTTTTTTTTDQAPPATGSNPANQQDKPQPTTATLVSPDIKLYDKKTRTFGDVLNAFANTVKASAIGAGVQGFFTVNASGTCPQWVVPQTDWTPSIALGPIFCSSSASLAYQIAGYAVLAAAAFAAFAIAFL